MILLGVETKAEGKIKPKYIKIVIMFLLFTYILTGSLFSYGLKEQNKTIEVKNKNIKLYTLYFFCGGVPL